MQTIEKIFEPSRLLVVWHSTDPNSSSPRRVVGEVVKEDEDYIFRYLKHTNDYKEALKEGLLELPAFSLSAENKFKGALDVFKRRLPPPNREDYIEYLSQYSLPKNFTGSTFSLLGYTGAKLASDTFELCPDLSDANAPLDLLFEVSGSHHYVKSPSEINIGEKLTFQTDPFNKYDHYAVKVLTHEKHIGFINRAISQSFTRLLETGSVSGEVIRCHTFRKKIRIIILVRYR
jgi:hypothetical protein